MKERMKKAKMNTTTRKKTMKNKIRQKITNLKTTPSILKHHPVNSSRT